MNATCFARWAARWSGAIAATAALVTPLPADAFGLTVGYFGETGTHPGVVLGAEQRLGSLAGAELVTAGQAGFYAHPGYTNALFARTELALRWPLPGAFDVEAAAGLGVLHARVAGDLYTLGPSGAPERTLDLGSPAWMPTVAIGVGRSWEAHGRAFGRLELFGQYPYNGYVLPHAALSLGWTWRMP